MQQSRHPGATIPVQTHLVVFSFPANNVIVIISIQLKRAGVK